MGSRYDLLTVHDARSAFRLVGEIQEIGGAPSDWAEHLLAQLDRIVGAPVSNRMECDGPFQPTPQFLGVIPYGFDGERRRVWEHYWATRGTDRDPSWMPAVTRSGASFTCLRSELLADRDWYGSAHVNDERRTASIDHFVISHRVLGRTRWTHTMLLYRGWGERAFTEREVQWVELVHEELGALLAPEIDPLRALSPRLLQTLQSLVRGDSEKVIADRMSISAHTVHEHVKALYRHFGVHSRSELLARWARSTAMRRPLLSGEGDAGRTRPR